jgi:hypothetical protein
MKNDVLRKQIISKLLLLKFKMLGVYLKLPIPTLI